METENILEEIEFIKEEKEGKIENNNYIKTQYNNYIEEGKNKQNNMNFQETKIDKNGKYIGEFKNGVYEGKGIYYYNNGDKYEGNFKNGVKEGKGIEYYNNGDKYEGNFKNGVK